MCDAQGGEETRKRGLSQKPKGFSFNWRENSPRSGNTKELITAEKKMKEGGKAVRRDR